ncbi:hypothetical protein SK128_017922, partial [Halocaridina rubra]
MTASHEAPTSYPKRNKKPSSYLGNYVLDRDDIDFVDTASWCPSTTVIEYLMSQPHMQRLCHPWNLSNGKSISSLIIGRYGVHIWRNIRKWDRTLHRHQNIKLDIVFLER